MMDTVCGLLPISKAHLCAFGGHALETELPKRNGGDPSVARSSGPGGVSRDVAKVRVGMRRKNK